MLLKLVLKILIVAFCAVLPLSSRADTVITNFTLQAMAAALTNGGMITFTNVATNATLALTNGSLVVSTNTIIDGSGLGITFSGNTSTNTNAIVKRVFYVTNNVTLTLANLSVINGEETNGAGIFVASGAIVNITNCTFSGNKAFGDNGRNGNNASSSGGNGGNGSAGTNGIGGAIYNLGTVNITNSLISSNTAFGGNGGNGGRGGDDSSFGGEGGNGGSGAVGWGGGIYNGTNATLFIINSTLTNNFALGGFGGLLGNGGTAPFPGQPGEGGTGAGGVGGGIYNLGTTTITNSTFVINAAIGGDTGHGGVDEDGKNGGVGHGGGIYNLGTVFAGNSTFTENFVEGGQGGDAYSGNFIDAGNGGSALGGAIYSTNALTIGSSTLATNNAIGGPRGLSPLAGHNGSLGASLGGNIYRLSGQVFLRNSILVKGTNGLNYSGTVIDSGYNISSDATPAFTNASSRNNTNALLFALANNGGPTATMALRTNSPAVDKGDPVFRDGFDQRGIARLQGTNTDIGAFELVPSFSISGKISEGTNGVSNIVVTAGSQSATTGTNGNYSIFGLSPSNYVVTPTPVGAGFTPTNINVLVGTNAMNPSGSVTGINFFANPAMISSPTISFISTNHNLTNAVLLLQFTAMPQRTYRIQYSTNLNSTNWKNISTNLSTTNGFFQFSQTNLATNSQRFYRTFIP